MTQETDKPIDLPSVRFYPNQLVTLVIKQATILIWNETTVTHRHTFETLDWSLKDITTMQLPFGRKIVISREDS